MKTSSQFIFALTLAFGLGSAWAGDPAKAPDNAARSAAEVKAKQDEKEHMHQMHEHMDEMHKSMGDMKGTSKGEMTCDEKSDMKCSMHDDMSKGKKEGQGMGVKAKGEPAADRAKAEADEHSAHH